jgi:hypothetical protein
MSRNSWSIRTLAFLVVLALTAPSVRSALAQKATQPKAKPRAKSTDAAQAGAASNTLDLSYVTSDPVMALVLRPRRAFQAEQLQMLPFEVIQAAAIEQAGVDPAEIEELIALFSLDMTDHGPEPSPAVIVRFAKTYDRQAVLVRLTQLADVINEGDRPIYQVRGGQGFCVCLADRSTIVGAREKTLRQMLDVKGAASPLIDRLKALDSTTPASAVLVIEPLRPLIQMGMASLPPLPPPLSEFTTVPNQLAAIEFHLGLDPQVTTSLVLEGVDEAAAAKLKDLLERAIDMGMQAIEAHVDADMQRDDSATGRASVQYVKRVMRMMIGAIERILDGKRITVRVEGSGAGMYASTGVLVALLLPAVQAAREAARRSQSINNLKQIALAMQEHADVFKRFPGGRKGKDGKLLLSWRVQILPFLEEKALYDEFHLDEPWDSEHNRSLIARMPAVFRSPNFDGPGQTIYLATTGGHGLFRGDDVPLGAIRDGLSNTILAVEADPAKAVIWTKPDDLEIDSETPVAGLGHVRPGAFLAVFCDASARAIRSDVAPETLRRLFDPRDGKDPGTDY